MGLFRAPFLIVAVLLLAQGCAAIPLASVLGPAAASGAGSVAKVGTEYRSNGTVIRTIRSPLSDVRDSAIGALKEMQIDVTDIEETEKGGRILARAAGRVVDVRLEPVTPVVTRLQLVVKKGVFGRDRATASEILAATEQKLDETQTGGI